MRCECEWEGVEGPGWLGLNGFRGGFSLVDMIFQVTYLFCCHQIPPVAYC